jgi:protein phosphatase 2C family protein 2/3
MDNCLAPSGDHERGRDNMSVIIIALLNGRTKDEWYNIVAERVDNNDGPVGENRLGILLTWRG